MSSTCGHCQIWDRILGWLQSVGGEQTALTTLPPFPTLLPPNPSSILPLPLPLTFLPPSSSLASLFSSLLPPFHFIYLVVHTLIASSTLWISGKGPSRGEPQLPWSLQGG